MNDYIRKMRQKLGQACFIHPGARIIIEDPSGNILLIRRTDNGRWGLPAGGLEEGESIVDCIIREVQEETGLLIDAPQIIGLSTTPERERVTYPNGDVIQYFTVEFYANTWQGKLRPDGREVSRVKFWPVKNLPPLSTQEQGIFDSLRHFRRTGTVRLG